MMVELGVEQESFRESLAALRAQEREDDPLERMRSKAWQQYLSLGLPTRGDEAYRYIKLRQLFSQVFSPVAKKMVSPEHIFPWVYPECRQSVIVYVNGSYSERLSHLGALPPQAVVSSIEEAASTYGAFLSNHWTKSLKEEKDSFVALNSALHDQGAFIYLPPKCVVETPIQVLNLIDSGDELQMMMPRLQVFAGAQAELRLVSTKKTLGSRGGFVNQVADFIVEEGAHLHYTQVLCDEPQDGWHFDAVRAIVKKNGSFKTVCATEGSGTVRCDYRVALTGENSEALLNGISMLSEKKEGHVHILVEHQAPHCRSYQLFKNVLNDFSRSSFEGKIFVRQAAQKTEAFQLNNNLILSDHAHADSKPNLEIFADDVKASHGATVGQLDTDQLFYMKTRGLSDGAAKNLLIYGFCEQVIEMISLPSLREEISVKARHYLTRHAV